MSTIKTTTFVIMFTLIFTTSTCYAITPARGSEAKRTGTSTSRHEKKIKKVAATLKKIDDYTLYLNNNQTYDLRGVKVMDFTGGGRFSKEKTIVEMTFINGKLKVVTIR
jgi:translation elongation factor P/translation initiation factor 5A